MQNDDKQPVFAEHSHEWVLEKYGSPFVRAAMSIAIGATGLVLPLAGIGLAAADAAATTVIGRLLERRSAAFWRSLASHDLDAGLLESEDFVHQLLITYRVALQAHRAEKIKLLADLLGGAARTEDPGPVDEYEEFLATIASMSYREFQIVALLETFEKDHVGGYDTIRWHENAKSWTRFQLLCDTKLEVEAGEVNAIMTRLERTGLVQNTTTHIREHILALGPENLPQTAWFLTPLWTRLAAVALYTRDGAK